MCKEHDLETIDWLPKIQIFLLKKWLAETLVLLETPLRKIHTYDLQNLFRGETKQLLLYLHL